jgi:hypothetical protein
MRFHSISTLLAFILFVIEVLIGVFFHDPIIRPYLGDVLVIPLIYYTIYAIAKIDPSRLLIGTILFAIMVEILQYMRLVERLGLKNSKWANIALGTTFSWIDLLCYLCGGLLIYTVDIRKKRIT